MKTKFTRLFNRMLSNKGYTIDQTILIVAIIAILITLVIVTVGWQLINRAGGTKAGAQIKQVEDANGQFFSDQHMWPQDAYTAPTPTAAGNVAVLVKSSGITTWNPAVDQTQVKNLLPGFTSSGLVVNHTMGAGGQITQLVNTMATVGADKRLVIQFANVPLSDAKEAEKAIDGTVDVANGYKTGRMIYSAAACLGTAGGATTIPTAEPTVANVYVCYAANSI